MITPRLDRIPLAHFLAGEVPTSLAPFFAEGFHVPVRFGLASHVAIRTVTLRGAAGDMGSVGSYYM